MMRPGAKGCCCESTRQSGTLAIPGETVLRESFHLRATDERLFTLPLTPERSERVAVEWGARYVAIERATHRS